MNGLLLSLIGLELFLWGMVIGLILGIVIAMRRISGEKRNDIHYPAPLLLRWLLGRG